LTGVIWARAILVVDTHTQLLSFTAGLIVFMAFAGAIAFPDFTAFAGFVAAFLTFAQRAC